MNTGIQLQPQLSINSILFVDDQVILQESEDGFQRSMFSLVNLTASYKIKVSMIKTKAIFSRKGLTKVKNSGWR